MHLAPFFVVCLWPGQGRRLCFLSVVDVCGRVASVFTLIAHLVFPLRVAAASFWQWTSVVSCERAPCRAPTMSSTGQDLPSPAAVPQPALKDRKAPSGKWEGFKKFWASSLPRSDLPGAKQPTPCGINRYLVLLVYVLYVFLTGCVYFGWASISSMLLKASRFSDVCPKNPDGTFVDDMRLEGHLQICDKQEAAVQHLYTMTLAVHTTMSSVAGTTMDLAGPLITALLGQLCNFTGWALLASGARLGDAASYAGFVFIGMGADMGFLPTLCITRLFPGSAGLSITILGSAASASFAIPLILESIVNSLGLSEPGTVFWAYAALGPGLCIVLLLVFMPRKGFLDLRAENIQFVSSQGAATAPADEEAVVGSSAGEDSKTNYGDSKCAVPGESFWRQLFSAKYIVLTTYFVGVGWVSSFYQEAHNRLLSAAVKEFLKIVLPLSFVPCIIWGYLADRWGIIKILLIINTSGLLMYLFTFGFIEALGYLSVLCFMNYMSLFTSQVFVYIEQHFTYEHFGKLIGIIQMVGGLLSLACNPLYSEVAIQGENGIRIVQFVMVGLLLLQYCWIGVLVWLGRADKTPHQIRQKSALEHQETGTATPTAEA